MEDKERKTPEQAEESNAARLLRLHGDDRDAELTAAAAAAEPIRKASWLENFWYHHKGTVIIVALCLLIAATATIQLLSRENPDVYVMCAGSTYLGSRGVASLEAAFGAFMEDANGDGEKTALISSVVCAESGTGATDALKQFQAALAAGDEGVFFLSPYLYQRALETGVMVPLAEVFDELPDCAVDDYGIALSETAFYKACLTSTDTDGTVVTLLPADTVVCIRKVTLLTSVRGSEKAETQYARHKAFLRALVAWEPENDAETAE